MKKKIFFILIVLFTSTAVKAQKYFTKTGLTEFKASNEAFEPVEAKSNNTTAILNTESGEVAALIFVRSFHFKIALMEEHFNENYMESDQFPKASFKGVLTDFDWDELQNGNKEYELTGDLTIKGKTQKVRSIAQLKLVDGKIKVVSSFNVKAKDFDIEIPSVVRQKIAENIAINIEYELEKK